MKLRSFFTASLALGAFVLSSPNAADVKPLRVLMVSSGYSDDPVMAQPAAYGFAAVLPKPYEPVELVRLVKSLLATRAESGAA